MPSRVLLLHGPNLNLLLDLPELDEKLVERAEKLGIDLKTFQANSEGALVDALHAERTRVSGIIVNAARLAPSADILAEAISLIRRPAIEVVLEAALKPRSALKEVVIKQVSGKDAYASALEAIAAELRQNQSRPTSTMMPAGRTPGETMSDDVTGEIPKDEVVKKTIGKKAAAAARDDDGKSKKTMGRGDGTQKIGPDAQGLSRSMVKDKIAERLSGKLTPAGLATWARSQWQMIQRGSPVESGQREKLEDVLQTLLLSASSKANDHQLIELMTQLG